MSSEESDSELGPKDVVFAVMGPTGTGKSTFINAAVGKDVTAVGHSIIPCTTKLLPVFIDPIPTNRPELKGRRLVLLDTPGFDDTHEGDAKKLRRVAKWLDNSGKKGGLIGGVLYFHDISAKRFNRTANQNLLSSSHLCGYDGMRKTALVTTNWSSDSSDVLGKREQEMKAEHWKTLIDKGLQVFRFQGDDTSAWNVIDTFLNTNSLGLQIQTELIQLRMTIPQTEVGQKLRYTVSTRSLRKLGPKDIVFPVMGPTGVGKSTFINIALDKDVTQVGHSTTSCTKQPLPIFIDPILNRPELSGFRLVLLDTPGFDDDTHEEDAEILKRVAKTLEALGRNGALVGAVLYFHDISAKRCNRTASPNILSSSHLCGYDGMRKTALVTTNWSSGSYNVLDKREQEMTAEHWKTLIDDGLQVFRFQRDHSSAWDVINALLNINSLDLRIQMELIQLRMTIPHTEAGQKLRYTLKQILKMQKEVVALEDSFSRSGDRKAQENLENMRATIGKLRDQAKNLRVRLSLPKRFLKLLDRAL